MFIWKEESAPIVVLTFEVYKTSEFLVPYFNFFRENFLLLEDTKPNHTFSRFIGPFSSDYQKLIKLKELFNQWKNKNMAAYPRGNLDSDIIICGIAPGWTKIKFFECFWLLGPSSKILYQNIKSNLYYYTNICKASFEKNRYSLTETMKWFDTFYDEIKIIKPKKIIFLGSYDIYDKLEIKNVKKIKTYHPTYFVRSGKVELGKKYLLDYIDQSKDMPIKTNEYTEINNGILFHKKFVELFRKKKKKFFLVKKKI